MTESFELRLSNYELGTWFHVHNIDEMEKFYLSRLPAIRSAARQLGYAIGVHGSCRRDFDLMAMRWTDKYADKDTLARAIQNAACGIMSSRYTWETKPSGRVATSMAICWPEWYEMIGAGTIDLSILE
ncbi:hypothetical protein EVB97_096 [Rhizobium phage RHph_Y65]|uniref:Uncharacterized protein n=1 Tax=Rhizobium phage RHph_Y65 TaxID=2509785 RepID=A0A7S5UXA7_9CAUD|nr:hypothetical protein PQC17_gp096 [Rhizobium phage RHph_Y65]QIG72654.1 hypothetical protein EVB97_096 [Rhizobium phage RHph_Y65]